MEIIGYVISAKMANGKLEYLCLDRGSGGYPYWGIFDSAKYYSSAESAAKIITESGDFTRNIVRISITPVIIGDAVSEFDVHAEITSKTRGS